ncbi:hypothetical protein DW2_05060 [Thioclava atlantica]|uniref:Uncharacterized protein n=2 Tax=Thioclava atlantica TaxID=1317124 RepID=A0A085TZ24_9RHOB|nr:hypothetical protein DW2_05060 [Thioclava atlantica]
MMLGLFIAATMALCLLGWAEMEPSRLGAAQGPEDGPKTRARIKARHPRRLLRRARPAAAASADEAPVAPFEEALSASSARDETVMARVVQALTPAEPDLPRISGFAQGDRILITVEGPVPPPHEIVFDQAPGGARVVIEGEPVLIIDGVAPEALRPDILEFRGHAELSDTDFRSLAPA